MKILKHSFYQLIFIIFLLQSEKLIAQPLDIYAAQGVSGQSFSTCDGNLFSSGGFNGYSDNENWAITICPDNPGSALQLNFTQFNLDTTNTAAFPINNRDIFLIYNGNSVGTPLIGTYSANDLQGILISASASNPSGCITIEFHSNNSGVGNFEAIINCYFPCQRPTAVLNAPIINLPDTSLNLCIGESVFFDASSSFASLGYNISQYHWDFDDGLIDTTSGSMVSHSFNQPGDYLIDFYVKDSTNCVSTNPITIQVLVSTTPSFSGTSTDTTICLGEYVCLFGNVIGTTFIDFPHALDSVAYISDFNTGCLIDDIYFDIFTPGQVITNINQLPDICVNMEHSYIGDLVITVECPNGTEVILYQQQGGWNSLGEPIDVQWPAILDPPGIGYDYCWSNSATLGTWGQCGIAGATPNIMLLPSGIPTLIPGVYSSLNPLTALVGCPLNGIWTLTICDQWGADDGWLFDWTINFDSTIISTLYSTVNSFTPQFGSSCDSTYWMGNDSISSYQIITTSLNCDSICIIPNDTGVYSYTYYAIDNFGCTYSTTTNVTIVLGAEVDAGDNLTVCANDTAQLNAIIIGSATNCNYTLNLYDSFGDGWNGAYINFFVDGAFSGIYDCAGSFSTFSIPISAGTFIEFEYVAGTWESEVSYEILDCDGNIVFSDGPNPLVGIIYSIQNGSNIIYSWSPGNSLSDSTIANPTAIINQNITYYVTAYENGHPLCSSTDSIFVAIDSCLSIEEIFSNSLLIYPNPSNGIFSVSTLDAGQSIILIHDVIGNLIISFKKNEQKFDLDLSNYSDGIYFISIENSSGKFIRKLLKN